MKGMWSSGYGAGHIQPEYLLLTGVRILQGHIFSFKQDCQSWEDICKCGI